MIGFSIDRILDKHPLWWHWISFSFPPFVGICAARFPDALARYPVIGEYYIFIGATAFFIIAICIALQIRLRSLEQNSPYRNRLRLYRFAAAPKIITGAFLEDGQPVHTHQADIAATKLVQADMVGVGLTNSNDLSWNDAAAPRTFSSEPIVLLCGPVGNSLTQDLNEHLSKSSRPAFYFSPLDSASVPQIPHGHKRWIVAHNTFRDIQLVYPANGSEDYGIIFVGKNPKNENHWLVWLAGLGPHGTVGAARAFVDERVQAVLASHLRASPYVSALVKYRFTGLDTGTVTSVLFTGPTDK